VLLGRDVSRPDLSVNATRQLGTAQAELMTFI
jgi:hypothetical protein